MILCVRTAERVSNGSWGTRRFAPTISRTKYYDTGYAPFGQPYFESGTGDRDFTGMDQQIASGIYEFPAREYNGDEGRWPSPDPADFASVNPADPQTWNRYAYVRNSPSFMTDPTGMGDDWGGANGEDPYCLEDFCANGMPDYYGNDYDANDWVQAPDSGFGCMWNGRSTRYVVRQRTASPPQMLSDARVSTALKAFPRRRRGRSYQLFLVT